MLVTAHRQQKHMVFNHKYKIKCKDFKIKQQNDRIFPSPINPYNSEQRVFSSNISEQRVFSLSHVSNVYFHYYESCVEIAQSAFLLFLVVVPSL